MSKQLRELFSKLKDAGIEVRDTKAGWQILAPDGSTITVHRTESDHRAMKNTLARLKRAGVQLDKETDLDIKARKQTIEAVKKTLAQMGNPEQFSVSRVYSALEMAPQTVYRALDQMGYYKAGHGVWARSTATQVEEVAQDSTDYEVWEMKLNAIPTKEYTVEAPKQEPEEREFIDSKDSFTIDPKDISDLTIDQFARTIAVSGLKFEIRVWR